MSDAILYALDGDVATITFNRPDRLNALTFDMIDDLSAILDRVVEEGARCLLLTGNGREFSTGADLQEMDLDAFARDIGQMFVEQLNPAFEKLANLPIPIVTAVNGPAAGAGCSLCTGISSSRPALPISTSRSPISDSCPMPGRPGSFQG